MEYNIENWQFLDLLNLYETERLNLNPPYQRKDIWSLPAKKNLIDTITRGMPLPAFFLHLKEDGSYDMVDGQQRTRAVIGYKRNLYSDLSGNTCEDSENSELIDNYQIPVIIIQNVSENESIEDVYYRVNKYGEKPNRPEIIKSEYFNNPLQILIEELIEVDSFTSLNLFTDSKLRRMADIDLVGELMALLQFGITDKKKSVDRFYQELTNNPEFDLTAIREKFLTISGIFQELNERHSLRNTRFYQRNDFYTYFGFINNSLDSEISREVIDTQYDLLVSLSPSILPSSDCYAFQEYTRNCITQSNSTKARNDRLYFFNSLLLNTEQNPQYSEEENTPQDVVKDVLDFYGLTIDAFIRVEGFYLIDPIRIPQ